MHRLLMLDLDGTLVDTVDDLAAAVNAVLKPRGLKEATRIEVRGMIGNGAAALVSSIFAARSQQADDAAQAEFLDFYTEHSAVMSQPFPGAVSTLTAMAENGWRFAVCTNKPETAARKLIDAVGLSPWCTAIGGGDSFPFRKPNPAHLLATIDAAGGATTSTIMIGDHANDVMAAVGAGVPCIFAGWGYGPTEMAVGAVRVAGHFGEVEALCEHLLPRQP